LILDAVTHWGLFLKILEAAAGRGSNATVTVEWVGGTVVVWNGGTLGWAVVTMVVFWGADQATMISLTPGAVNFTSYELALP
jgi:hypothetical protein